MTSGDIYTGTYMLYTYYHTIIISYYYYYYYYHHHSWLLANDSSIALAATTSTSILYTLYTHPNPVLHSTNHPFFCCSTCHTTFPVCQVSHTISYHPSIIPPAGEHSILYPDRLHRPGLRYTTATLTHAATLTQPSRRQFETPLSRLSAAAAAKEE